jgi:hypothetical protein
LNRRPGAVRASRLAIVALRTASRIAPQVFAVKLDQVEGIEEDALVVPAIADAIERRDPVIAARHVTTGSPRRIRIGGQASILQAPA